MLRTIFLILTLLFTLCFSCSFRSKDSRVANTMNALDSDQTDAQRCKIYLSVLKSFDQRFGAKQLLIIRQSTIGMVSPRNDSNEVAHYLQRGFTSVRPFLINEYLIVNQIPATLPTCLGNITNLRLVDNFDPISAGTWEDVYAKYPGATIVELSQIGFDSDKVHAMIYISSRSGSRTGWGYYVLLKGEGSTWQVTKKLVAWVN